MLEPLALRHSVRGEHGDCEEEQDERGGYEKWEDAMRDLGVAVAMSTDDLIGIVAFILVHT